MTDEYIQGLMEQFNKKEFLQISGELGLDFGPTDGLQSIVDGLVVDLEENGVPVAEDCSDLLSDFLYVAMFVDEDGELIEIEDIEDIEEEEDFQEEEEGEIPEMFDRELEEDESPDRQPVEDDLPECFSFADERDPACKRCKVFDLCNGERIKMRPDCFGKLFDENDEHCEVCLERTFCKEALESV